MRDILFVDDDPYSVLTYVDELTDAGFCVQQVSSADEALREAVDREFAAAVLDVRMLPGQLGDIETAGGHRTGVALARRLRRQYPRLPIFLLTSSDDTKIYEWTRKDNNSVYLDKKSVRPHNLVRHVRKALRQPGESPNVVMICGGSHVALPVIKDYLQNALGFNEPKLLFGEPNEVRSVIDQFKYHASDADVVMVLLTPDELGRTAATATAEQLRSRQNIIFELGYFLCAVGRRQGKVFALNDAVQDLLADLAGVVHIDISHGTDSAIGEIRRDLAQWL